MRSMRVLLLALSTAVTTGCVSFVPLERGDWRRVYTEDASGLKGADAKQELIPVDKFEDEVSTGIERAYSHPAEFKVPILNDAERIDVNVGEILEFLVDEREGQAELFFKGTGVDWYWNPMVKTDEWVNDEGVTRRRSLLFVVGRKRGLGVLRLLVGNDQQDFIVTVK